MLKVQVNGPLSKKGVGVVTEWGGGGGQTGVPRKEKAPGSQPDIESILEAKTDFP